MGEFERAFEEAGPVLTSDRWGTPVRLAFSSPRHPYDDDMVEYLIEIESDGLKVTSPVMSLAGGDGLPAFLEGLADDFRGWSGVRSWRSLEDQLRIEATWSNRGHVSLHLRVKPSVYSVWDLGALFTVEAGAEMQSLAADLARFFAREGSV